MDTIPVWVTANSEVIELSKIGQRHLERIIKMVHREDICCPVDITDVTDLLNFMDTCTFANALEHTALDLALESTWFLDREEQVDHLLTGRQRLVTPKELKERLQELQLPY